MKDRFNLLLALAFLAVVAVLGGASRADALSQTPLRLIALIALVAGLWAPNHVRLKRYRPLFWFLALTALLVALQLVPLPHDVWAVASVGEVAQQGPSLSFTVDRTPPALTIRFASS